MLLFFNYIFIAYANSCSFVWQAGVTNKVGSCTFLYSMPVLNSVVASSCSFFLNVEELAPPPALCRKHLNSRIVHVRNARVVNGDASFD